MTIHDERRLALVGVFGRSTAGYGRPSFGFRSFVLHLLEVSTGAPIYLVSACASAEEFVAAFRRYTDRTGVFVPMAEPLPAGRTGRFALTLTDGGVMIDGEAQVAQAWPKGGGLHGRPGMTLKFLVLDDTSKTVLGELEQARLAMKPRPPSVPARPATIPATPRPALPALGGRIDAANARAESIAIGDLATLRDAGTTTGSQAPGPGKFAIPSIPTVGRPKTPSTAPELGRTKSPTMPPPDLEKPVATPAVIAVPDRPTAVGPLVTKPPADVEPPTSEPVVASEAVDDAAYVHDRPTDASASPPTSGLSPVPGKKKMTSIGFPAVQRIPAKTEKPDRPATSLGVAPLKVTQTQPLPIAPAPKTGPLAVDATPPPSVTVPTEPTPRPAPAPAPGARRSQTPSTPPPSGLRNPTPVAPLPITRAPAQSAPAQSAPAIADDEGERTDLNAVPLTPEDSGPTAVGGAPQEAPVADRGEVSQATAPAPAKRAGGMRASEILAAIPDEDWTMTPDAAAPTVLSSIAASAEPVASVVVEPSGPAKGPPTGDWTMSADPAQPGGWTAPSKVEPPPRTVASGNPVLTVASREIQVQEWEDKPTGIGEPLVQIDSTLMEPLESMPIEPVSSVHHHEDETPLPPPQPFMPTPLPFAAPGMGFGSLGAPATMAAPTAPYPPLGIPTPVPGAPFAPMAPPFPNPGFEPQAGGPPPGGYGAPPPFSAHETAFAGNVQIANPSGGLYDPVGSMQFPQERTYEFEARRRKRLLVIGVFVAVAIAATLAIVLLVGGHKSTEASSGAAATPNGSGSGTARPPGSGGSAAAMVTPPGSAAPITAPEHTPVATPPADAAVTSTTCSVDLTTTPPGAQIAREDGTPLGTSPGTFDVPCGSELKLVVRKQTYYSATKAITATEAHTAVTIALARALFSLKVTSMPPGATITVAGKSMGVTPTTIKLPAFQPTNITLTKDGFASDTQKLTIKQNNMAHFVSLKRQPRH